MSYLFLVSLHVVGIESEYFVVRTIWTCGSITPAFFIFFLKRFFASFLGSSSGAVRTVFLSIAHRTTVHSSTRKRGTRSSKSNISGKLPSNSLITMPVAGDAAGTVSRKNLKEDERRAVIDELLEGNSGELAHGDIKRVAQQFGCSTKQVSAVWRQYKSQKDAGIAAPSLRSKRAGNYGRKGVDVEALREKLKQIPMKNRTTCGLLLHSWSSLVRPSRGTSRNSARALPDAISSRFSRMAVKRRD